MSFQESKSDINQLRKIGTDLNYKHKIIWKFVAINVLLQAIGLYGFYVALDAHYPSVLWALFLWYASVEGVLMGSHRLYSHKSFKATWPVRLTLVMLHTMAGQFSVYRWARDHRLHHKYTDTDADPHNSARGFFFSHYGWICHQKHPMVYAKTKEIDVSDLKADKLVMFQKEHILPLYLLLAVIIPVGVPMYFWNETFKNSFFVCFAMRNFLSSHSIASINSFAHAFGTKPYDKNIRSVENMLVTLASAGEGWHNYHHAFPWDYKAAELGSKANITALVIDLLARLGLVYDLKTVTPEMITARALRTGDGTHSQYTKEKLEGQMNGIANEEIIYDY